MYRAITWDLPWDSWEQLMLFWADRKRWTSDSSHLQVAVIIQKKKYESVYLFHIRMETREYSVFLKPILLVLLTIAAAALVVSCWMSQTQAPPLPGCTLEQRHGVALPFPIFFLTGERVCGLLWASRQVAGGWVGAGGGILWSATTVLRKVAYWQLLMQSFRGLWK